MAILTYIFLLYFTIITTTANPDKVVCYHGIWSVYRGGNGRYDIEDIDPFLCTHLIYSFVGLNDDGTIKILDHQYDIINGGFARFNALKQQNHNLKTLIAVGGWVEGSQRFSNMVSSQNGRTTFINSAINFMNQYGFDGFDIDWEYPSQREGSRNSDKENFGHLLREFRTKIDQSGKGYLLTAAVAATAYGADTSYDVPALSKNLDFVNFMAYDYHSAYDGRTGENSPLYASPTDLNSQNNVDAGVTAWLSRGLAPQKLVLGIPTYGVSYTLSNPSNHGLGAPSTSPGNAGPLVATPGTLGYNEICLNRWQEVWDNDQHVPYAYNGDQWVGYENPRSIKEKVDYGKSKNLGGFMIWSLSTDDFRGSCGQKYPLLTTIRQQMGGSIEPTKPPVPTNPPVKPTKPPTNPGGSECTRSGYMRDPKNCSKFYYCVDNGNGGFIKYEYNCPTGLAFDTNTNSCNYINQVEC